MAPELRGAPKPHCLGVQGNEEVCTSPQDPALGMEGTALTLATLLYTSFPKCILRNTSARKCSLTQVGAMLLLLLPFGESQGFSAH